MTRRQGLVAPARHGMQYDALILSDALMRDVDREDVEAFLAMRHASAREAAIMRMAEEDVRYETEADNE